MILIRLSIVLALSLFLVSPRTGLKASDEEVAARTVRIGDRLLVVAAPPYGATETVNMPAGGVLSMLGGDAVLQLDDRDLYIKFANEGVVRIVGWLSLAYSLQLPSGATLSTATVMDLLRSSSGGVDIAALEANAVVPTLPPDAKVREFGSTRGSLGDDADWLVARKILGPDDEDLSGFRAYSYLLFADDTAEGPHFERRLAAITSYVRQFEVVGPLMRRFSLKRKDMNIFISLVDDSWDPGHLDPNSPEAVVKALMSAYDFPRARLLLRRLELPTRGPYIISGSKPLLGDRQVQLTDLMVMDLSWIAPRLVDLWLTEFRRIAEGEYEWESGSLRKFALLLLSELERIAPTVVAIRSVVKLPK